MKMNLKRTILNLNVFHVFFCYDRCVRERPIQTGFDFFASAFCRHDDLPHLVADSLILSVPTQAFHFDPSDHLVQQFQLAAAPHRVRRRHVAHRERSSGLSVGVEGYATENGTLSLTLLTDRPHKGSEHQKRFSKREADLKISRSGGYVLFLQENSTQGMEISSQNLQCGV
jgi:hypothetical protein